MDDTFPAVSKQSFVIRAHPLSHFLEPLAGRTRCKAGPLDHITIALLAEGGQKEGGKN